MTNNDPPRSGRQPRFSLTSLAAASILVLCLLLAAGPALAAEPDAAGPLVVYCAHDSIYSEKILRQFEKQSGITIAIRFDSEATKSLGLTELIVREASNPRCDVFWNNQFLGTDELKTRGLLLPYQGPGYARIADPFKDPDGAYCGFAARLRVYIVNTERLKPEASAIAAVLAGKDLSRVAIAKPLYGTTLTHLSVLWQQWGGAKLQAWHADIVSRGVQIQGGNATVKNLVAAGVCDLGMTDSDDYFEAQDAGKKVAMLPILLDDGAAICIPNSVAIIKGTPRVAAARRLVDFLLSKETELALSRSSARQIPLGKDVTAADLSADVRALLPWAHKGVALAPAAAARQECLAWLKAEYLR